MLPCRHLEHLHASGADRPGTGARAPLLRPRAGAALASLSAHSRRSCLARRPPNTDLATADRALPPAGLNTVQPILTKSIPPHTLHIAGLRVGVRRVATQTTAHWRVTWGSNACRSCVQIENVKRDEMLAHDNVRVCTACAVLDGINRLPQVVPNITSPGASVPPQHL